MAQVKSRDEIVKIAAKEAYEGGENSVIWNSLSEHRWLWCPFSSFNKFKKDAEAFTAEVIDPAGNTVTKL